MSARAKSPPGKSVGAKPGSAGGGDDEARLRAAQAELVKESELRNYAQLEKARDVVRATSRAMSCRACS